MEIINIEAATERGGKGSHTEVKFLHSTCSDKNRDSKSTVRAKCATPRAIANKQYTEI